VFLEPLGRLFHTVPFRLDVVIALGLVGSIVLWVEELRKLFLRRRRRSRPPAASSTDRVAPRPHPIAGRAREP
jgi:hypothetical protein